MSYKERAKNALCGLAIGDALGWPAFYHRTYALPFWTRRLRREIDVAQESKNITRFPMPFSLNRPTEHLQLGPTDDTEWASFTAELLVASNGELTRKHVYEAWHALAHQEQAVRGSISTQGALHNLKKGLTPPESGIDNAHYFDDAACARAVVIGVANPGALDRAFELATIDGEVTNSRDGLWAAQAFAVALSSGCGGSSISEAVEQAISVLPKDSWVKRTVAAALQIVETSSSFGIIPKLDLLVNKEYSYGGAAPEVLALALALALASKGDWEKGCMYALGFPKLADSLPALVGALLGACQDEVLPDRAGWEATIQPLQGICIPQLAGGNFLAIIDQLITLGERTRGSTDARTLD